jgi:hypothetical protein
VAHLHDQWQERKGKDSRFSLVFFAPDSPKHKHKLTIEAMAVLLGGGAAVHAMSFGRRVQVVWLCNFVPRTY